jgi:N-acetylmuramoyl-L-alanine amidase
MRNIDYIVIHCTATPQTTKVSSILSYWKNVLKWRTVGYHILIEADGTTHNLLDFHKISNGVKGYNNNSIHISYIGGVDAKGKAIDNRTAAQKQAILKAILSAMAYIQKGGNGTEKKITIQGHRDFPNVRKDCPSFDAKKEYN